MVVEMVPGEGQKAYVALCDYCRMGAGRSLSLLLKRYQTETDTRPPTTRLATLKAWSSTYSWQERVATYDAGVQAELEAAAKKYRATIMEEGFALDHERVKALKEVAGLLLEEVKDEKKRWAVSIKVDDEEIVTTRSFNFRLVEQTRGLFDDIAKEVGGRRQRTEITGKDGGPIQHEDVGGITNERRIERLVALYERVRSRIVADPAGG